MTKIITRALCAALLIGTSAAADALESARIYSSQGQVTIQRSGKSDWSDAAAESHLGDGDAVRTGDASRAAIVLASGVMVRLGGNSLFRIGHPSSSASEELSLDQGAAHFLSRKPVQFPKITTPVITAAMRGTEFTIETSTSESKIALFKGAIDLKNKFGELTLSAGELGLVKAGEAPKKTVLVDGANQIQWALYYPNLISVTELTDFAASLNPSQRDGLFALANHNPAAAQAHFQGVTWQDSVGRALALNQQGESEKALSLLKSLGNPSPSIDLLLAAMYLERGAIDRVTNYHRRAEAHIAALAPDLQPGLRTVLLAQQSAIDLTENRGDDARSKLETARTLTPSSASAALTYSYVMQSEGDVDSAREAIAQAAEASPNDYNLKARLAELLLSFGESKDALELAQEAAVNMPNSSYAYTVKGFAELARTEVDQAHESFERAVTLSSGEGLPYLGLGLTEIRRGDLTKGRMLIQEAAHLEPQRSLYRSYLGKALFEEEEEGLAAEEYQRAIELDPEDPTPYLYRSFYNMSTNQPVQALADVEKSISINENRAVYRSRLLLDQDLSVRGNSLAHVYDLLGFSHVSRVEAIKSLSRDYSNHSAHLMLSQSYDGVDDLVQGSISEFFISRLLSPVNFNLIRPSQAGIVSSNEYNAVFDRDIRRRVVGFDVGSREKLASPTVRVAGTEGKFGYALSSTQIYSNGYRDNDSRNEQQMYGTMQYQFTPDDTFLLDVNGETFDNGDDSVGYNPLTNNPQSNQRFDDYLFRAGFNHRFGPGNMLIAQVVNNHSNFRITDRVFNRPLYGYVVQDGEVVDAVDINAIMDQRFGFKSHGTRFDAQHIYNSSLVSNVFGGGYLDSNQHLSDNGTIGEPEGLTGLPVSSVADNTEGSQRVFEYLTVHAASWADFQVGVSYNKLHISGNPLSVPFQETTHSMTTWDPKVGVVLTPFDQTTVRAAYFENVGTAGIREFELIEPTILSGFNQTFFDVYPGTQSRNLAFGLDQKLDTKTYFGAEGLHRALTRQYPITVSSLYFDANDGSLTDQDIFVLDNDAHVEEDVAKAYFYQVLGQSTTATVDYQWNRDQDHLLTAEARTNRVRTGLNYFHPSGFLLFARGTWRKQNLTGYDAVGLGEDGRRDFWIVDAGAGYRFHKRHGQIILALNNILDKDFHYVFTGIDQPFLPGIGATLSFAYNF